jgi:DNA-binding winged helix-turn-helix (wHTH) protein
MIVSMRLRFDDFTLDRDRRALTRGSERVHVTAKAFQLLELLVDARPKPVSQKAIRDALWPDTFVDDGSLHNLIHQLRQALGARGHEWIKTAYGYGFAFAADAVPDRPATSPCILTIGNEDVVLTEGDNIVGREWEAAVRINAPSISRNHACIRVSGGSATIRDLGSKNGTTVGGQRLRTTRELADGDQIIFGSVAAKFRVLPSPRSTETAR